MLVKPWKWGAHQGYWWQSIGFGYNSEVWVKIEQQECEGSYICKANYFPQSLQSRAGTDQADAMSDGEKGIGVCHFSIR